MEDFELTLFDRLNAIKDTINKYGEENFYLSFSGGKDSTILHYLLDMALPNNQIPRVYSNTGIDLLMVSMFVRKLAEKDSRIKIINPSRPIISTLEKIGYPFKSKHHSYMVEKYQRLGMIKGVKNYLGIGDNPIKKTCPKKLQYQFTDDFKLKVSDLCCFYMKEQPLTNWAKENNRQIAITGIMRDEGGRRVKGACIVKRGGKIKFFNPLVKITKEFEEWLIEKYNLEISPIYNPPYNFKRTGCKGCPFAIEIQSELDTLQKLFPNERKQCELIWKPVYSEYRRIGYRLKEKKDADN